MKIAIHNSSRKGYFSERWISFCKESNIPYVIVDCYSSDIIKQLEGCNALMWHFSHADARDFLFAKQLIFSLEAKGLYVFPDYNSCWHFDDKVAQKYLFEAIGCPMATSYVFYSKKEAIEWAQKTSFPKVFKLRGGAGSSNVRLVKNYAEAKKLITKSFGRGFRQFDRISLFKDSVRSFIQHRKSLTHVFESLGKIFILSEYERIKGKESGYIYFQEFYPRNPYDIRVIVIGGQKAFAIKRLVRENDFRASGSGHIIYDKNQIDLACVDISFKLARRINANCVALDFIYDNQKNPIILEISFGFLQSGYDKCEGYWNEDLCWHEGKYCQQNWMVEDVLEKTKHLCS